MEQEIYIYIDDSGVLHSNDPVPYFVYAGYVFTSKAAVETAKRKYRSLNRDICKEQNKEGQELKACDLEVRHKRALYNVMKKEQSLSLVVNRERVYDNILQSSMSMCRYKDYVLKRAIKEKLKSLLSDDIIFGDKATTLHVNVDEQLTATNGTYSFEESLFEELKHGFYNYDYGMLHAPIFSNQLEVKVKYCDSRHDYLVQASDILANRIFASYRNNNINLRENIPKHRHLTFP